MIRYIRKAQAPMKEPTPLFCEELRSGANELSATSFAQEQGLEGFHIKGVLYLSLKPMTVLKSTGRLFTLTLGTGY